METTKLNSNIILFSKPIYTNTHSKTYLKDGVYYKVFNNVFKSDIDNMTRKLCYINNLGINDQILLGKVDVDGSIVGYAYEVPNYKDNKEMNVCSNNTKKKIKELEALKNKINILHENGIIHGDIKTKNIVLNNGEVLFRDLDNVSINGSDFNHNSKVQCVYVNRYGINETLDTLALNIAYISHLNNVIEEFAIDYVNYEGKLPKALRCAENDDIMDAMISLDNKENIKPFIIKKRH